MRSALAGERKHVTVLFADVKGSMELAEQVDPEVWHYVMDRFFTILNEGVHRFEGTINQYTGDGIMALFGAPIAHEDHAQRACYSALHLRDALRRYADDLRADPGLNFSVRMGLNSGEVIVGSIGDDLRMDYTAQGHTVGLAARMEQLAEPGKILLAADTAHLVQGYFKLRELGATKVRGVSNPVPIFELAGVGDLHTRFDHSRARGLSRFVGRNSELTALDEALELARRGQGQVVGIVGDPGVGKSRLCHEFTESSRARGIRVTQAQGVPHGKTIPLLAWMQLLRGYFGVAETDSPEASRDKIAGRLLQLDPEMRSTLPTVFNFLGVPDASGPRPAQTAEEQREVLFEMSQRSMRGRTRNGIVLITCFDDVQWLDSGSERFLADMVAAVADTTTLVLVNFRPEFQAEWMSLPYYRQLDLRPLGEVEMTAMLDDLLGQDASLRGVAARIARRTAGNPFFVEEVVQNLYETGYLQGDRGAYKLVRALGRIGIPTTVQAILAARIDRLPESAKALLQVVAVIGKECSEPVLLETLRRRARVDDVPTLSPDLSSAFIPLIDGGFITEKSVYPERVYAFRHPLTHEVAYHSQLSEQRQQLHAAAAESVAMVHSSRLDEHAALLAHHWESSGDMWTASQWHARAGEWASGRDRGEAMRHWRKVRDLVAAVAPSPEVEALALLARQHMLIGGLFLGMTPEEATQIFREGISLAKRVKDRTAYLELLIGYATQRAFAGAMDEGLNLLREAVESVDQSGSVELRFVFRASMIHMMVHSGELDAAIALAREAETLIDSDTTVGAEITGFSPLGLVIANRGFAAMHRGDLTSAMNLLDRARRIAEERSEIDLLIPVETYTALLWYFIGDGTQAVAHARRSVELAEASVQSNLSIGAHGALGIAYTMTEQWEEAIATLELSLAGSKKAHAGKFLDSAHLAHLAIAQYGAGRQQAAIDSAQRAVTLCEERHSVLTMITALLAQARCLRLVDPDASAMALGRAREIVERSNANVFAPMLLEESANQALAKGDAKLWRTLLAQAQQTYAGIGAGAHAQRLDAATNVADA